MSRKAQGVGIYFYENICVKIEFLSAGWQIYGLYEIASSTTIGFNVCGLAEAGLVRKKVHSFALYFF